MAIKIRFSRSRVASQPLRRKVEQVLLLNERKTENFGRSLAVI